MPKIDIVNAKNIIESNPEKAFFKLKNTGGPKGDTGAQGPQGPKGDQGEPGAPGASASVTVGSTTTLSPGADATVTNSGDTRNAILNFGIPTGAQGPQGIQGPKGDTGPMGQTGAKGDTGAAATVQVGNTNTGAPGTNAQVTNAGNEHFAVFNFTIPRGDKGETGATGAQGPKGDTGEQGPQGIQGPKGDTGSVKSDVVAELPETGEEDTFYLVNREATEQTATGKTINFTNSDNSGDITDFKLDGETSQNGTPTPDAPVAVNTTTGENVVKIFDKNFIDSSVDKITQQIGASVAQSGNGFTVTGASSGGTHYVVLPIQNVEALLGKSVTASCQYTGSATRITVYYLNSSGAASSYVNELTLSSGAASKTFTMPASLGNNAGMGLVFYVSTNASATFYDIQLELGTATAYEPYQGQSYEVNLGKNLFDKTNASQILTNTYVGSSSIGTSSGGYTAFIPCEPNTAYTISKKAGARFVCATTTQIPASGVAISGRVSDYTATSITLTTDSTAKYLAVFYFLASADTGTQQEMLDSLQIEKGSQPTSYAAYFEPIELCKIGTYQDSIYKSGDKWYVHKEIGEAIIDGSETWNLDSGSHPFFVANIASKVVAPASSNENSVLCDQYAPAAIYAYNTNIGFIILSNGTTLTNLRVREATMPTLADFKARLAQNNATVYTALATPTDTEITNEALIEQLDNVASAPLYTGVNNIITITPNEQGTLEIKYVTYDKYNQNKVYIWNDTLQQWQIIVS